MAAREVIAEPFIDKKAIRQPSRAGQALLTRVERFAVSLAETSIAGFPVPRSAGHWRMWETTMGTELMSLGVPKRRVVKLFSAAGADPEDERTRVSKNLRRSKSKKVTINSAGKKKPAAKSAPKRR